MPLRACVLLRSEAQRHQAEVPEAVREQIRAEESLLSLLLVLILVLVLVLMLMCCYCYYYVYA